MHLIGGFIVVVSAMLVGQTMAEPSAEDVSLVEMVADFLSEVCIAFGEKYKVPSGESLITLPQPSERLSKYELEDKVSEDNRAVWTEEEAQHVAHQLNRAQLKCTRKLYNRVTIRDLLELNYINPEDCNEKHFERRRVLHQEAKDAYWADKCAYGIPVYMGRVRQLAGEYCIEHRNEVISRRISDDAWLQTLARELEHDKENYFEPRVLPPNEQ